MRELRDASGATWDVVVGKESWGTLVLLFSRRGASEVRTLVIAAESQLEAERELDALSDDDLRQRLSESAEWGV